MTRVFRFSLLSCVVNIVYEPSVTPAHTHSHARTHNAHELYFFLFFCPQFIILFLLRACHLVSLVVDDDPCARFQLTQDTAHHHHSFTKRNPKFKCYLNAINYYNLCAIMTLALTLVQCIIFKLWIFVCHFGLKFTFSTENVYVSRCLGFCQRVYFRFIPKMNVSHSQETSSVKIPMSGVSKDFSVSSVWCLRTING